MANRVTQSGFGTITIPGGYVRQNIVKQVPGLSPSGYIGIIGEATGGAATSTSGESLAANLYSPSQLGDVIAKFQSGPIVDAFRQLAAPSNDPNIIGAPTGVYIYKTNQSTSASSIFYAAQGLYGTLEAQQPGNNGNQLNVIIEPSIAAVSPVVGPFTFAPGGAVVTTTLRLNGGAALSLQAGGNIAPNTLVSTINTTATSLLASGGVNRASFSGNAAVTLSVTVVSGNQVQFTLGTGTFAVTPVVGDTVVLPATGNFGSTANSVFAGAGSANLGAYVVTSITNTSALAQIGAFKVSNSTTTVGVINPVNVSTTFSAVPNNDLQVYSPVQVIYEAGLNRNSFTAAAATNASVTVVGSSVRFNFLGASFNFGVTGSAPQVGDNLYVPSTSVLASTTTNVGWYSVGQVYSQSGASYLIATRLSSGAAANVSSTALSATPNTADVSCIRPWLTGDAAALSISDAGAAQNTSAAFLNLATTSAASFISTQVAPVLVTGTEYSADVITTRSSDSLLESLTDIGGNVILELGYFGTTASVVVSPTTMTFTVSGGPGSNLTVTLANFTNLGSLVDYLSSQPGYDASALTSNRALPLTFVIGGTTYSTIDAGTCSICSSVSSAEFPGQLKADLYSFVQELATSSVLNFTPASVSGLPNPTAGNFLSGGSTGATSGAVVVNGIDAFAGVDINYLVPLFSQDASVDAQEGYTASGSTYQIDAINAYVKTHCIAMSTPKMKKNRSGVCSKLATFAQVQLAAQSLASDRIALAFQEVISVSSSGALVVFQPWMNAITAAGMQVVGEYEAITNKVPNLSGAVSPYGVTDFDSNNPGDIETALLAGLLVIQPQTTGGLVYVSDQTTYSQSEDLIPNSMSAMLCGDIITVDLAKSSTAFIVGRPSAVMTQAKIISFIQQKMSQYLQNLLISPSQGAPAGFNSLVVSLSNGVVNYSLNVYIDSEILYVLGTLNLSTPSFG